MQYHERLMDSIVTFVTDILSLVLDFLEALFGAIIDGMNGVG